MAKLAVFFVVKDMYVHFNGFTLVNSKHCTAVLVIERLQTMLVRSCLYREDQ